MLKKITDKEINEVYDESNVEKKRVLILKHIDNFVSKKRAILFKQTAMKAQNGTQLDYLITNIKFKGDNLNLVRNQTWFDRYRD